MLAKGFSSGQVLKFGWETMKKHVLLFIGLFILVFLIGAIPYGLWHYLTTHHLPNPTHQKIVGALLILLYIVLKIGLYLGYTRICIKMARGENYRFIDLFSRFTAVPSAIIALILFL